MKLLAVFLCFFCVTGSVFAPHALSQDWFTREACDVAEVPFDPSALAESDRQAYEAASRDFPNAHGRFWRVTSPGGAISHLWGTIHTAYPIGLQLPTELHRAIEEADTVAVEIDWRSVSRAELRAYAHGEGLYTSAPHFGFNELDPQVREWLDARLTSIGYQVDWIPYLEPGIVAEIALYDPCEDFYSGIYPVQDARIMLLGELAGAEVIGLEPRLAMRERLKGDPDLALAIVETYSTILNPDYLGEGRGASFALYREGRIGELMALERAFYDTFFGLQKAERLYRRMHGYLVNERNRDFLRTALPHLRRGKAVIAVGAFHLPGAEGLVEMLRRAGFTVERVPIVGEVAGAE
jgi:uncharacterized protein YbaP (TraB family)